MDSSLLMSRTDLVGEEGKPNFLQAHTPKHCNKKHDGTLGNISENIKGALVEGNSFRDLQGLTLTSNYNQILPADVSRSSSWESKDHPIYDHNILFNEEHNVTNSNPHFSGKTIQQKNCKHNNGMFIKHYFNKGIYSDASFHAQSNSKTPSQYYFQGLPFSHVVGNEQNNLSLHYSQDKVRLQKHDTPQELMIKNRDNKQRIIDVQSDLKESILKSPSSSDKLEVISTYFGGNVNSSTRNTHDIRHYPSQNSEYDSMSPACQPESDNTCNQLRHATSIHHEKYRTSQVEENGIDNNTLASLSNNISKDITLSHSLSNASSLASSPEFNLNNSDESSKPLSYPSNYQPIPSPSKLASLDSLSSVASILEPIDTFHSNNHSKLAELDFSAVSGLMPCRSSEGSVIFPPKVRSLAKRTRDERDDNEVTKRSENDEIRKAPSDSSQCSNNFIRGDSEEQFKSKKFLSEPIYMEYSNKINNIRKKDSETPYSDIMNRKQHSNINLHFGKKSHKDKNQYNSKSILTVTFNSKDDKNNVSDENISKMELSNSHTDKYFETRNNSNLENISLSIPSWEIDGQDSFGSTISFRSTNSEAGDFYKKPFPSSNTYQLVENESNSNNHYNFSTASKGKNEFGNYQVNGKSYFRHKHQHFSSTPLYHSHRIFPQYHHNASNSKPVLVVSESCSQSWDDSRNQSIDRSYNEVDITMRDEQENMNFFYCSNNKQHGVEKLSNKHKPFYNQLPNSIPQQNMIHKGHYSLSNETSVNKKIQNFFPKSYPSRMIGSLNRHSHTTDYHSPFSYFATTKNLNQSGSFTNFGGLQIPALPPIFNDQQYNKSYNSGKVMINNSSERIISSLPYSSYRRPCDRSYSKIPLQSQHNSFTSYESVDNSFFHTLRQATPSVHLSSFSPYNHPTLDERYSHSIIHNDLGQVYGWSRKDDMRLTRIMKKFKNPKDWELISKEFGKGRTSKECQDRWIRYLKPGVRKGQWQHHEDVIVVDAVTNSTEQPFTRWSELALKLPGRVGKQIRDRWVNHLNPNINHMPFSRDDDLKLWEGRNELGKRWVEISTKYFSSSRSENHIKNRWYSASFKKFIRNEFGADAYNDVEKIIK